MSIKSDVKLPECVCVRVCMKEQEEPSNTAQQLTNKQTVKRTQRAHVCPFHKSDKSNFNKAKQTNAIDRTMYTHHTTPIQWMSLFARPPSNINTLYSLVAAAAAAAIAVVFILRGQHKKYARFAEHT